MIADDHALVREGIRAMLEGCGGVKVAGEAADGKDAVDKTRELAPDIVLMDIAMPGLGGLEATIEIKKTSPDTKVVVLSQYGDREYVDRFLKAGVSGYVLKTAAGVELVSAIRAVARGETYLDPAIASGVVGGYLGGQGAEADPYERLTDREKQVIKLLAEGATHKAIADTLNISVKTVVTHQANISEKLGIHSRTDLVKFAIRKGIIRLERE